MNEDRGLSVELQGEQDDRSTDSPKEINGPNPETPCGISTG
jgi:hypothetical protein